MTYPWEKVPEPWEPPFKISVPSTVSHDNTAPAAGDVVQALQRDLGYMVTHTAVLVHSNQPALRMLVNTARGQIVPHGECKFTDGSTFELQDIGMPQPGTPALTVKDLLARVWEVAKELGLELQT